MVLVDTGKGCGDGSDDIEDICNTNNASDLAPKRGQNDSQLIVRSVRRAGRTNSAKEKEREAAKAVVPGTHKIWMKTYGCSHNVSDSEYMQGMLADYGYVFAKDKQEGDIWLLNSCTVKDPSQSAFMHLVNQAKAEKKPLVVAGCVPQGERSLKGLESVSVVGVQQIDRIVEVVEETLKGNTVRLLQKGELPRLDLPKIRKNPMIEIIPLSTGCLGACTYCKTRHARGKLGSYEPSAIVDRVQTVLGEGVTEVWLSSEDTGAYGIDLNTTLPALLRSIVEKLPDGVMLRVGMTNPPYILDHLDAIAEILNHPSVFSFLHVPVQSGSNKVLADMNREYTVEEFNLVVDTLTEKVPDITIATDIICGFPTESDEDFEETMDLMRKYKFGICNISQFYPRPGTPAAKMTRVPTGIVKDRSRKFTKLFQELDPYKGLEGEERKVWVNTEITDDGKFNVGHTKNYTKVLLPRDDNLIGSYTTVKITSVARFHVVAEVIGDIVQISTRKHSQGEGDKSEKASNILGNGNEESEKENVDGANSNSGIEADSAETIISERVDERLSSPGERERGTEDMLTRQLRVAAGVCFLSASIALSVYFVMRRK